jgi:heme-degrading monooxygenase HmoA
MIAAIALLLAMQQHGMSLNPNAVCDGAKDRELCAQILPMVESVDPAASLALLQSLIAKHGWPSADLVGENASHIAMTVLQRAAAAAPKRAAVARVWRGRVKTSRADEYQKYLDAQGIMKMRAIKGNLGTQMFRRALADKTTEFTVISYWPNREAIRAFAGSDMDRPHPLPRDAEFLVGTATVEQYDVVADR